MIHYVIWCPGASMNMWKDIIFAFCILSYTQERKKALMNTCCNVIEMIDRIDAQKS